MSASENRMVNQMGGSNLRYIALFLVVLLSAGINLGEQALAMFGMNQDSLLLALAAVTIAGLLANQHLFVILLVIGLSAAINLPPELLQAFYVDREILIITLLSTIVIAVTAKLFGAELNTRSARV